MTDQPNFFTNETADTRVDKLIVAHFGERLSRTLVQTLIKDGHILVDGHKVKANLRLRGGEQISVTMPPQPENTLVAEAIPLNVVYEDEEIAVIDKPAGMIVHPGTNNETGTLVHAMLARWPQVAEMGIDSRRVGIVHRLDKDTSGLIVVGLNDRARRRLADQFRDHTVEKTYLALVERAPKTATGRIDAPIARDPHNRQRMSVIRTGKPAITEFTVIDTHFREGQALLRVNILTGRTHQIRVHLAFIGSPVVGDQTYGFRTQRIKLKRQFLHATKLCFDHPTTGERLCFESALPVGLQDILEKLRE